MSQVYTFHETVIGHLHVLNEFPCEDASASFSADDGRYYIAVVADGHGSKSCFRSAYGSRTATEVALECLQQFAATALASEETEDRFYKDMFSNPRYRQMTIRQLTDTIIAGWHDRVLDDYKNNPPSIEEMGESAAKYEGGKNVAHIYGTTLIAALQLSKCLVLIQQGDGRCNVFYTDGSIGQPIPWDARCEDTTTTSLCDADVADSFRSCVIDLGDKPVMACYLGSDGVEDAYRDTYEALGGSHVLMGGVHTFYKDLTCRLAAMSRENFENYLTDMLPEFSANGKFSAGGSGDDISVAGIVDLDAIQQFVPRYEHDVKRYDLEEALFWKEDELRGKTRKHGILQKRVEEAQSVLNEARTRQLNRGNILQQMKNARDELAQKVELQKAELERYHQESQAATGPLKADYSLISSAIQHFFHEISLGRIKMEAVYRKMQEDLLKYEEQIKLAESKQRVGTKKIQDLEEKLSEAQSAFEQYDTKYQVIDADRIRIMSEIDALEGECQK